MKSLTKVCYSHCHFTKINFDKNVTFLDFVPKVVISIDKFEYLKKALTGFQKLFLVWVPMST